MAWVHWESLPPKGTQTFPKLQIALKFRVLQGKMPLLNISLFLSPTTPHTHVHNMEYGKQTQKLIWPSSRVPLLWQASPWKGTIYARDTFLEWFLPPGIWESDQNFSADRVSYTKHDKSEATYWGQWIWSMPALISHHCHVLTLLSCGQ